MRDLLLAVVFILAAANASVAEAGTHTIVRGVVVGIADGDTLTILDDRKIQYRVRLAGIDAPERSQPFGKASKLSLSGLAFRRTAEVQVTKLDRYGRLVGKVIVDDRDLCREQIRLGYAWLYAHYQGELSPVDRVLYSRAMQEAKAGQRGLWAGRDPQPPWVWRRR
jgi:endonuclease YncB( thermonuclease family)